MQPYFLEEKLNSRKSNDWVQPDYLLFYYFIWHVTVSWSHWLPPTWLQKPLRAKSEGKSQRTRGCCLKVISRLHCDLGRASQMGVGAWGLNSTVTCFLWLNSHAWGPQRQAGKLREDPLALWWDETMHNVTLPSKGLNVFSLLPLASFFPMINSIYLNINRS